MKQVILTVAEFLILVKVQNEVTFAYSEADEYIETNADKKTATDGLDEEMPELILETEAFDDVIDSVQHYKDEELASDDPEMPAVEALLKKLQAVHEVNEEVTTETESQAEEEVIDKDLSDQSATEQNDAENHPDEYQGADKD